MSIRNLPQRLVQRLKPRAKTVPKLAKSPAISDPLPSAEMAKIQAEQARIKGLIEDAARDGLVPDAHVLSLHACHIAELAKTRRQLGGEEAAYHSSLMRLEAMFPEPPAPTPEPPAPRSPKTYPRVGDVLGERGQKNPLH
jgi:hypothetical protein